LGGERLRVSFGIQSARKMGAGATKSALEDSIRSSVGSSSSKMEAVKGALVGRSVTDVLELPQASDWIEALMCSSCDRLVNHNYLMCVKEGHLTCHWCCANKNPLCQFSNDNPEANQMSSETASTSSDSTTSDGMSLKQDTDEESQSGESERADSAAGVGQVGNLSELTESETDDDNDDEHWKSMLDAKFEDLSLQRTICGGQLVRQRYPFVDHLLDNVEIFCPNWKNGCPEVVTVAKVGWHCKDKCQYKKGKKFTNK